MPSDSQAWPALPYAEWQDTCTTLHLWTQLVGKVMLARNPWLNHSWHVTLRPTVRGFTSGPIPAGREDDVVLQMDFDFADHVLRMTRADGRARTVALAPRTVADFRGAFFKELEELDVRVNIHDLPSEIPGAIPFSQDTQHAAYDGEFARRFARVLLSTHLVFERFRTGFLGKSSPSQLFWGGFDLAVTRFSGRPAPPHPGGNPSVPDAVNREAYSHEVASAGFWPGGAGSDDAAYYAYAYPEPSGYESWPVRPHGAHYAPMRLFLLPYDAVRNARDPELCLLEFLQSTYEAAAVLGGWDRAALESDPGLPGVPRRVP